MKQNLEGVDNWVTVHRMETLMDVYLLKIKLEFEEIEVQILDELTVEAVPFYSNAMGGVRIQVRESQQEQALDVLEREGYVHRQVKTPNKFVNWIDALAQKVPGLKNLRLEVRFLVVTGFLLLIIILPFAINSIPTISDQLIENNWCVEEVSYKNKFLDPDHSFPSVQVNNCSEMLRFSGDGNVSISTYLNALEMKSWNEYKNGIYIHSQDQYGDTTKLNVFEGAYSIEIQNDRLILTSPTTRIICERMVW